ncbi:MAG: hypothetical protein LBE33_09600 [Zoogloeaceae bacterium]|jgi:hypothetical protein|nr:hypothetical protein [Zoogloeaceae bacterium]
MNGVRFMKVAIRRFCLPLAATIVLWFASVLLFGLMAEMMLGSWESGRVYPFMNVHLLEAAAEGTYSPLQDPAFVLYSIAVVTVAFGLPAFWGAYGATRFQLAVVIAAILLSVALFAFHLRTAFSPLIPPPIKTAAAFILFASLVAGGVGMFVSRRAGTRHD